MKKLMIIAAVLFVSNLNAQSMRMDPSVFQVEMQTQQFGISTSSNSTQSTYINQTTNSGTGHAIETSNPGIAIVGGADNTATNIVVQEDLVAGKKGEGRKLFIRFYRKLFGN